MIHTNNPIIKHKAGLLNLAGISSEGFGMSANGLCPMPTYKNFRPTNFDKPTAAAVLC